MGRILAKKMNLQGRCQIKLVNYEAAAIT